MKHTIRYLWFALFGWLYAIGYALAYTLDGSDDCGERDWPT